MEKSSWSYKSLENSEDEDEKSVWHPSSKFNQNLRNSLLFLGICVVFFCTLTMLSNSLLGLSTLGGAKASKHSDDCSSSSTTVPQYFQTR